MNTETIEGHYKNTPSFRKPYTVDELVTTIYEENYSHFDFMENMNGGDCDCALHLTMQTIGSTMGWEKED